MTPQPASGHQANILTAFTVPDRSLAWKELIQATRGTLSGTESFKFYKNCLIPPLSRLRKVLNEAFGFPDKSNPIRWEKAIHSYFLEVMIGHVHKDVGRLIFEPVAKR